MSLTIIGSNTQASYTLINMYRTNRLLNKHMLESASGKRINQTMDDASGFSLARGMEARRRGIDQAIDNIDTATNVLEIAMNGYTQIDEAVLNIYRLAIQAADDAYTTSQRQAIQDQIDALLLEVDTIVDTTEYQSGSLIDGSYTGKSLQSGSEAGETTIINLLSATVADLGLTGINVTTQANATAALTQADNALETLRGVSQDVGEYMIQLQMKRQTLHVKSVNTEATRSRIEDADYAYTFMKISKGQLINEMGMESFSQAVYAPSQVLTLFV